MAGHPTIGSTFALAAEGALEPGRPEFVFELGVGPTPVSLEWGDAGLSFAWMTQPPPAFGAIVADRAGFAAAAGLAESDLAAGLPVQSVSCGVPFLFAPIASRRAVDSVAIDRRGLAKSCGSAGLDELPVFFFTTEPGEPAKAGTTGPTETVYSRMLAPGYGIAEDPATGGASGPLGLLPGPAPRGHPRGRAIDAQPARRGDGTPEPDLHLDRGPSGGLHARQSRRTVSAGGARGAGPLKSDESTEIAERTESTRTTEERRTGDNYLFSPMLVSPVTPCLVR